MKFNFTFICTTLNIGVGYRVAL